MLNLDRMTLIADKRYGGVKYTADAASPVFRSALEFLDHSVKKDQYCYKDVVQPFIVAEWLRRHPEINVIKIIPNVAHVAYSMIRRGWYYPAALAADHPEAKDRLIEALIRAASEMSKIPGTTIVFDDVMFDLKIVERSLQQIYPDSSIKAVVIASKFEMQREEILKRRTDPDYAALQVRIEQTIIRLGDQIGEPHFRW